MNRNKYLFKNTALYGISTIATKLITFLMVPFYTHVLTVNEYGTVDIIFTSLNLLIPVLTLCIHQAMLRFTLEKDSNKKFIFTQSMLVASISIVMLILLLPLFSKIQIFNHYGALLILLFSLNIIQLFIGEFIRGLEKISLFIIGNITFVFISIALNIYTIAVLNLGVRGYIISSCLAYLITIILYFIGANIKQYITREAFKKKNIHLLLNMLKYSIFLIPNSLFWWITNASDRYIILAVLGVNQNGIYAVANKIPVIITSVGSVFIQAWTLTAIKENSSGDKVSYYKTIFHHIVGVVFIISSGLLVIIKIFTSMYVSNDYFVSWESSTFLILSAAFNVLASFIGNNYVVAKHNFGNMLSTLTGAMINIVLNIILIPRIGIIGAAVATYISYFIVVIYRTFDTRKYIGENKVNEFLSIRNVLTWLILHFQIARLFVNDNMFDVLNLLAFILILNLNKFMFKDGFRILKNLKYYLKSQMISHKKIEGDGK